MEYDQNNKLLREQNYNTYVKYWINFLKKYILSGIIIYILANLFFNNYSRAIGLSLFFIGLIWSDLIGIKFKIATFKSVKSASYSTGNAAIYWNIFSVVCKLILFIFVLKIYV